MRIRVLIAWCLVALAVPSMMFAGEALNLTAQEVRPQVVTASCAVDYLGFSWSRSLIEIELVCDGEAKKTFSYTGATAVTLMRGLNKANLSTTSLQKRVLERLSQDGRLVGTVTGTPD